MTHLRHTMRHPSPKQKRRIESQVVCALTSLFHRTMAFGGAEFKLLIINVLRVELACCNPANHLSI